MTTEKLAIEGGTALRSEPFGNVHTFGEPELDQLMQIIDEAPEHWHSGYKVREFEDGFARRHGVRYAVATDSGTGALHAAVAAVDPEPGDEIITAPVTDIGSVLGIMLQRTPSPSFRTGSPARCSIRAPRTSSAASPSARGPSWSSTCSACRSTWTP